MAAPKQPPKQNPIAPPGVPLRNWSKLAIGLAGTALLILLGVGVWYVTRPSDPTPAQYQLQAMALIEKENDSPKNRRLARKIALELQEIKHHDPDFPGASEYILGIVAFRDALEAEEDKRGERFKAAIDYLQDAERLALNGQYRPEWAYALGISLHALGSTVEARPYIEEALRTTPGRVKELTTTLIEVYLELKSPSLMPKALALTDELLKILADEKASQKDRDMAVLLKARVLVALERTREANEALKTIDFNQEDNLDVLIIQAQTRMALKTRDDYLNAKETLNRLLVTSGINDRQTRQAHYLLGVCEEFLEDIDRAISQYNRTRIRYPNTHEGVAASLNEARLLREAGRDEEVLAAYESALSSMLDPQTYHNRWVSIEKFRSQILMAWNKWIEGNDYENAIALAKLMPPLFTNIQARELEARAYEKCAEAYQAQNASLRLKDPETYKQQLRERWNASGDAYSNLADLLRSSPKYADVLWISSAHYIQAYQFRKAKAQLEKFMATAPKERLPLASVQLAYTQLNDDQTQDALELLNRIIHFHSKDPASFRAAYLLGHTYLERNEVEQAQQTWRNILESSTLSPAAKEWQDSLFALGSTLYHVTSAKIAEKNDLKAKLADAPETPKDSKVSTETQLGKWDESIGKLNEYVRRYPNQGNHFEAQYLLARAYQKSASEYQAKLENAQIANEKQELAKEYHQRLRTAAQKLRDLRTRLMREEEENGLNKFQARLLQNAFFDLGDIELAMHEYEAALLMYSSAINRYPSHVRVLLSYLQMAQCYQQLGKPEEGQSMLKQAQILAQRMNDSTFASNSTNIHARKDWIDWFDWTLRMLSPPQ